MTRSRNPKYSVGERVSVNIDLDDPNVMALADSQRRYKNPFEGEVTKQQKDENGNYFYGVELKKGYSTLIAEGDIRASKSRVKNTLLSKFGKLSLMFGMLGVGALFPAITGNVIGLNSTTSKSVGFLFIFLALVVGIVIFSKSMK
jgi:hypothetical protein